MRLLLVPLAVATLAVSIPAAAQGAPPSPSAAPAPQPAPPPAGPATAPPPGQQPYPYPYPYQYPPPGYGPPPGYPPPPGYAPPGYYPAPQRKKPARVLPYKDGAEVPDGYHVEERMRPGLLTAGIVITAIPYTVGVISAATADFRNESGWLGLPFVGPWMMMGRRSYHCKNDRDSKESLDCLADIFVVMGLITSGAMQTAGGTLLLVGALNPKKELVRDEATLHVTPMRLGTGYGVGVTSMF